MKAYEGWLITFGTYNLKENIGKNKLISSSFDGQIYASILLNLITQDKNISSSYVI